MSPHLQYSMWWESALARAKCDAQRSTQSPCLNPRVCNYLVIGTGLDFPQYFPLSDTTFQCDFRRGKSKIGRQTCPFLQPRCSQLGPNHRLTGAAYPRPQSHWRKFPGWCLATLWIQLIFRLLSLFVVKEIVFTSHSRKWKRLERQTTQRNRLSRHRATGRVLCPKS